MNYFDFLHWHPPPRWPSSKAKVRSLPSAKLWNGFDTPLAHLNMGESPRPLSLTCGSNTSSCKQYICYMQVAVLQVTIVICNIDASNHCCYCHIQVCCKQLLLYASLCWYDGLDTTDSHVPLIRSNALDLTNCLTYGLAISSCKKGDARQEEMRAGTCGAWRVSLGGK